jgi:hypothetical protein
MRILLDECVNQRLRTHLSGHECQSARYAGLGGLKNGELLEAGEAAGFDVLLTVDRGFQYEQNLKSQKDRGHRSLDKVHRLDRSAAARTGVPSTLSDDQARRNGKSPRITESGRSGVFGSAGFDVLSPTNHVPRTTVLALAALLLRFSRIFEHSETGKRNSKSAEWSPSEAVLCRTNGRLNDIAEALEARDIPVLHLGSLFEREEVRDLLALLSLAVDRFGTGLARIGAMARYDLSLQDVYLATCQFREAERPALEGLSGLATTAGLSKAGAEGLARLAGDLEGLSRSLSSWEYLAEYLLDRSELVREMARRESVPERMRAVAVWQFLNFVREQSPVSSGLRIQRTLDRVRQLVLLAEERDLRQVPAGALHMNAVRLMTIHGSKGLEFEAVHIPGLTAASIPSSRRGQRCPPPVGMIEGAEDMTVEEEARQSQEHEEQCLFFVALSRARTHLRLYLARLQPNGKNRSPSMFLAWMPSQVVVEIANPKTIALPCGDVSGHAVTVTHSADLAITDSSLSAYQKCPRRYFYT